MNRNTHLINTGLYCLVVVILVFTGAVVIELVRQLVDLLHYASRDAALHIHRFSNY